MEERATTDQLSFYRPSAEVAGQTAADDGDVWREIVDVSRGAPCSQLE